MEQNQGKPQTWNQAAKIAVGLIGSKVPDSYADLTSIRYSFEFIENVYFEDKSPRSAGLSTAWAKLGADSISFGSQMALAISSEYLLSTLIKKQRDYGPNNIARFGRKGIIIRVHDKIARLENLLSKNLDASFEPIQDTVLDIAGYAAIGIMWESGTFLLALE